MSNKNWKVLVSWVDMEGFDDEEEFQVEAPTEALALEKAETDAVALHGDEIDDVESVSVVGDPW